MRIDIQHYGRSENETCQVVSERQRHEGQQQEQTYFFCPFHELVTRLMSRYGFVQQDDDMPSIQSGNRQQVHDRQIDRDQRRQYRRS